MDWREVSEINFGRIIKGDISPTRYNPSMFFPPYDKGFHLFQEGKDKGEIVREIGLDSFQAALYAQQELNGAGGEVDWAELLEKSALRFQAAEELDRVVKKLRENVEPDWSKVQSISTNAQNGLTGKFFTLDEVWDREPKPNWQKSGIRWLDRFVGGWPKYGVTVVGGRPKGGKTSLCMGAVVAYVRAHTEENAIVYTIEMMIDEFKERLKQLEIAGSITKEERGRIFLCEHLVSPEDTINWAASIPNVGIIFIDYVDMMISGENSESKTTALYMTMMRGAKQLKTSIILLAQFSGKYEGGIPRPYHVRYSRLIEAIAVMEIMLYVPYTDWFEPKDTEILPVYSDQGYVIKWLARYQTRQHSGTPHAILIPFDGAGGFDLNAKGEYWSVESKGGVVKKRL